MTSAPSGASATSGRQPLNGGFAAPSPLEVAAPSAEDIRRGASSKRQKDYGPQIPIVLDDSDEIIELD